MLLVEERGLYYTLAAVAVLFVAAPWVGQLFLIRRGIVDQPWWQQNRVVFSYRVYARLFATVATLLGVAVVFFALKNELSPALVWSYFIGVVLLTIFSFKLCWLHIRKRLGRKISLSLWTVWGHLIFFFVSSSSLLFSVIGMRLVPDKFGWETFVILALLMGAMIAWHFHFAVGFLKWLRVLVSAPRYVIETVRQLAMDQKFSPLPEVWELRTGVMNAFAFQAHHAICFTTAAREQLTEPEIRAVAMHEMGHLAESAWIRFLRQLSPFCFFPLLFFRPLGEFQLSWVTVLVTMVLLQLYGIIQRRMETQADHFAASTATDEDPQAYGDALIKLYQGNLLPAVLPGRARTHPHLYDRLESIGYRPDFSRPEAPVKVHGILLGLGYALVLILCSFGLLWWQSQ